MIALRPLVLRFLPFLLPALAAAQTPVQFREVIVPAPPFSICIDGATHLGTCTGMRFRPDPGLGSLVPFEGQPIELVGTAVTVTCTTTTVTAVSPLRRSLASRAGSGGGQLQLEVYGSGANNDTFLLFAAVSTPRFPLDVPGLGPFHLDLGTASFLGSFAPLGPGTPMLQVTLPANPILIGVPVFQQALAVQAGGGSATFTNVDCFAW